MKKILLTGFLTVMCSFTISAQSKFSYSLLTNVSGSLDDQVDVCFLQTSVGSCYDLEKTWKVNFTVAANYQVRDNFRLQFGVGYNVFHMDELNEAFNTSQYQIKYLSIPLKAHYLIGKGKLKFYFGGGIRTDIRLNKQSRAFNGALVQDNGSGLGLSLETLLGLEFNVLPTLSLGLEPTFSTALSHYSRDLKFDNSSSIAPNSSSILLRFIEEKPERLGITLSANFKLN